MSQGTWSSRCRPVVCGLIGVLFLVGTAPVAAESPSVMFIMDVSGSMRAKMGKKTRMSVAKQAYNDLMDGIPTDAHVGLFVYGHHGDRDCQAMETRVPLKQLDVTAMKAGVAGLSASKGATPLTGALMLSVQAVGNYKRPGGKAIVLISDGKENCGGDPVKFVAEMTAALKGSIKVYVVGLGVNDKERAQLAAIATAGGGEYYAANDAKQLAEGLAKIKTKLIRKNLFVDDFDGPGLKDGLRIVNDNPDGRALQDGKLTVVTSTGSVSKSTLKNLIVYEGPAAAADYDVTLDLSLEFTAGPFQTHQSAGLALLRPNRPQDRLALYIYGRGEGDGDRYRVSFSKISGGKEQGNKPVVLGKIGKKRTFSMRVQKRGFKYSAFVKPAGAGKWTIVGNQSFLGKKLVPGFFAWRKAQRVEALVEFDRFQVDSIEK